MVSRSRRLCRLIVAFAVLYNLYAPLHAQAGGKALVAMVHYSSNRTNPLTPLLEYVGVSLIQNFMAFNYNSVYWVVGQNATRNNALNALSAAVWYHDIADAVITTHGGEYFVALNGSEYLPWNDLRDFPKWNGRAHRLRMVHQGTCYGETMNPWWRAAGADAVTGARYVSVVNALELPSIVFELGVMNRRFSAARDISWSVSSWLERFYSSWNGLPVSSYKHLSGAASLRVR